MGHWCEHHPGGGNLATEHSNQKKKIITLLRTKKGTSFDMTQHPSRMSNKS